MPVITSIPEAKGNTILIPWLTLGNGDTGTPQLGFDYADISVQIEVVTLGVGGTIDIEGSNDGVNFTVLTDPQGGAITFTASGVKQITEACKFYRPNCNGGDGTTDIDVFMFMRRQR